jgi:hypothetical protein
MNRSLPRSSLLSLAIAAAVFVMPLHQPAVAAPADAAADARSFSSTTTSKP